MRTVTFQTLIDEGVLQIGDGHRAKLEELGGTGYPFLRSEFVGDRYISFDDAECFHEKLTPKLKAKLSHPGDTVITTKGNSTGRAAYVREELRTFVYSPHLSFWRSKNHNLLHPGFIREWAHSEEFIDQLNGMKDSTDMAPYLSLTDQRRLRITVPEIEDQRQIAQVFGMIDDKIELNRQMNRTLEETAGALYRSWFVDFDPVVAKAAGRPPAHLSPALAALFPDSFQDSDLGPIPKGWRTSTVDGAVSLIIDHRGKTPTKLGGDWVESGIQAVSAKNVKAGRLVNKNAMGHITEELYRKWMRDELEAGDILMTSEAPLGELLYLPEKVKWCQSQRLFGLRANREVCLPTFLYGWLSTPECQSELDARSSGTTVMGIRQSELRTVPVLLPKMSIQEKYEEIVGPMLLQIWRNESESQTLAALRDTLLPKLLSGEVRVKEAENK